MSLLQFLSLEVAFLLAYVALLVLLLWCQKKWRRGQAARRRPGDAIRRWTVRPEPAHPTLSTDREPVGDQGPDEPGPTPAPVVIPNDQRPQRVIEEKEEEKEEQPIGPKAIWAHAFHPLLPFTTFYNRTQALAEGNLDLADPWVDSVRHLRPDTLEVLKRVFLAHHKPFQMVAALAQDWPWVGLLTWLPASDVQTLAEVARRFMEVIGTAEADALTWSREITPANSEAGMWGWVWDAKRGLVLKRRW